MHSGAKTVPRNHANKNRPCKINETMQISAIKSIENILKNAIQITDESDVYDTGLVRTGDQRCHVRILGGQFAGVEVDAVNRLSGSLAQDKLFSVGDKAFVVVSHSGDEITTVYMTDHFRIERK